MTNYLPKILGIIAFIPGVRAVVDWFRIFQQDNTNLFLLFEITFLVAVIILILLGIIGVLAFQNYKLRQATSYQPMYTPIVKNPSPSLVGLNAHIKLYDTLNDRFDMSELREIKFKMGIDEEWSGVDKSDFVTKLVMWAYRRQKMEKLYEAANERPDVRV